MCSIFTSVMGEWDHIILQNQKGLFTTEFLRILTRSIWLTGSLKLIGPQTLLFSTPIKKQHPFYILREGSPRQRLSKPQPGGWQSIFAVLLESSHSCLSLCCLWPYSKQDNSLPKIPTSRICDTRCSLPNKGDFVEVVKGTLGSYPKLLCCPNVTTIDLKSIHKTCASSNHTKFQKSMGNSH